LSLERLQTLAWGPVRVQAIVRGGETFVAWRVEGSEYERLAVPLEIPDAPEERP
jgi:hypothetical protein